MPIQKQQILPLVKPILVIGACVVIFSITWLWENKDKNGDEVTKTSNVTTQSQAVDVATVDTTISSINSGNDQENLNEQNNAEASSDSNVTIPVDPVQTASGNSQDNTEESNSATAETNANAAALVDTLQTVTGDGKENAEESNNSTTDTGSSSIATVVDTVQAVTIQDRAADVATIATVNSRTNSSNDQENLVEQDNVEAGSDPNVTPFVDPAQTAIGNSQDYASGGKNSNINNEPKRSKERSKDSPPSAATVDRLVPEETARHILSSVKQARPDLPIDNVRFSNIDGIYKANLQGNTVFFSGDGQFFIIGDMYQVKGQQLINLQEEERRKVEAASAPQRAKMLDAVAREDMVIFPALTNTKAHIYIFTDIDCIFCRKLHRQVPEMQTQGIEVRYLGFPRAGVDSLSAQKLATIWCAENPREAMTAFKQEKNLAIASCEPNPIADHYLLGRRIGILGTPSIVLSSGQIVSGAPSTEQLIDIMKESNLY